MALHTNEEVVDSIQRLAIVELGTGHSDLFLRKVVKERCRDGSACRLHRERYQHTIDSVRIGIEGDDGLLLQILGSIDDESILTKRDDQVMRAEEEVGQETAFDDLLTNRCWDGSLERLKGMGVSTMSVYKVIDRLTTVLEQERRLVASSMPLDEFFEHGLACDDNDFLVVVGKHELFILAAIAAEDARQHFGGDGQVADLGCAEFLDGEG